MRGEPAEPRDVLAFTVAEWQQTRRSDQAKQDVQCHDIPALEELVGKLRREADQNPQPLLLHGNVLLQCLTMRSRVGHGGGGEPVDALRHVHTGKREFAVDQTQ